jgi:N-acetylneuraminic acid mutarotase
MLAGMTGLIAIGGGIAALTFTHYLGIGDKPPPVTPSPHSTKATKVSATPTKQRPEPPFKGSWSRLPSLPSPKADNVAIYVRLQQRDYIYVTGGYRGRDYTPRNDDTLYRYNIAAGQWEIVTSQFPGMYNNAVVQDRQGNLFFTGGYSPDSRVVTSLLYRYQPDTELLQEIAAPGEISFGYGGSMLADQQDHLYLTQGFMHVIKSKTSAGTGWYRYDIVSDQWDSLASLPGVGVAYAVLAADGQGGIVLLGGVTDTEQNHGTNAIYRYQIASDTWTAEQVTAPQAFNGASSCAIGNGQVVVVGGYDPVQQITLNNAWLIDLNTLQSRPLASLPGGGSRLGAAAYDGVGNVYVVRGIISDPDQPSQDFWQLRLKR